MKKIDKIIKLNNQLLLRKKKISSIKKLVTIIIVLFIAIDLFTLLYIYKYLRFILYTSSLIIIISISISHFYIRSILKTCKHIEHEIYEEQKLKL
jgi:membrane protein YdbS with pleckstrin-like domain